jgi:hypothetical protein
LAPVEPPVVAALPGNGWWVAYQRDDDDEAELVFPVLAWMVHSDGTLTPADAGTLAMPEEEREQFKTFRLVPPPSAELQKNPRR